MRGRLLPLISALLLFLGVASPAFATTPTVVAASPHYDLSTMQVTGFRQADGNSFVDYTVQGELTGAFVGPFSAAGTIVTHPDGSQNVRESGTCACAVLGREGTLAYRVQGTGPTAGTGGGSLVGSGSGGLAGLHFEGTWQEAAGAITFAARLHFDPQQRLGD